MAQILDDIILVIGIFIALLLIGLTPFLAIIFIPLIIYAFYKHMKCQTLGRRILRIEVVNESGEKIGFWRGMLREVIGKTVSGIFLYVGFIWVAFDARKQGWHDKIASTYVISRT